MTAYTEIELRCDGGAGPYDCEPAIYDTTVDLARDAARRKGWLVAQRGEDYCPTHREGRR